jgi:hypothetical protein
MTNTIRMTCCGSTLRATLAAASASDERCAAEFFVGEWYLLRQDRAEAIKRLKASADMCSNWNDPEYEGAQAELDRLR